MKTLLERIVVNFLRKPKEPPVAPKKTLLERIAVEFLGEDSDAAQQAKDAEYIHIAGSQGMWSKMVNGPPKLLHREVSLRY
jgi:hypothetical protein